MGKKGPCLHCGIRHTPLWRNGPPDKPVLCNACGSRWRTMGTLENYMPKHATVSITKEENSGSLCLSGSEDGTSIVSSSGSTKSCPQSFINSKNADEIENSDYMETECAQLEYFCTNFPRKKRSPVTYRQLTTVEKLHRDLLRTLRDESSCFSSESPDDTLIYNTNPHIPANEIGQGCMLLERQDTSDNDRAKTCASAIGNKEPSQNAKTGLH